MSQTFTPDFDAEDQVHNTMGSVFDNTKTLKSSFSGANPPGDPEVGMLWADLALPASNILKVHGDGSLWYPLINLANGEIQISDWQITGTQISNDARKGSIVEGEDIVPASCTLRTKEVPPVALPTVRSYGVSYAFQPFQAFETEEVHRIYIDPDVSFLEMHAMFTRGEGRFGLSSSSSPSSLDYISSTTNYVAGTAWTSTASSLSVLSLSGWYYLKIQGRTTNTSQDGALLGFSFRFGV